MSHPVYFGDFPTNNYAQWLKLIADYANAPAGTVIVLQSKIQL
jgi:hypothetical protein